MKSVKERGNWEAISIEPHFPWPEQEIEVVYRGYILKCVPEESNCYPMVAVECRENSIASDSARRLLLQFISSLVWANSARVKIFSLAGGTFAYRFQRQKPDNKVTYKGNCLYLRQLPQPVDERSMLGLALYREAIELENPAYQVLGFSKIFNILYEKSRGQKDWINANLDKIEIASDRLKELVEEGKDIGGYIYESCRCAVAHAFSEPLINPDDPEDLSRLYGDLQLVKELAEIAIEHELGVKSSLSIYREHLYELSGFKSIFGRGLVEDIINFEKLEDNRLDFPEIPALTVRLNNKDKCEAFTGMTASGADIFENGLLVLHLSNADGLVRLDLYLNFTEERISLDLENGFFVGNDETARSALFAAEVNEFIADYLMNGILEVWNDDNELVAYCDPFIPTNILPHESSKTLRKQAEELRKLAKERESSQSSAN